MRINFLRSIFSNLITKLRSVGRDDVDTGLDLSLTGELAVRPEVRLGVSRSRRGAAVVRTWPAAKGSQE